MAIPASRRVDFSEIPQLDVTSLVAGRDDAALITALDTPRRLRAPRAIDAALQRYARQRRRQVLPALGLIDGLDALFGARSAELMRLRAAGLGLVDQQQRMKAEFMAYALGGQQHAPGASVQR